MQTGSKQQQFGHVVEQLQALLNHLKSFCSFAFVDGLGGFFKVLVSSRLLNTEELYDFVVVRIK